MSKYNPYPKNVLIQVDQIVSPNSYLALVHNNRNDLSMALELKTKIDLKVKKDSYVDSLNEEYSYDLLSINIPNTFLDYKKYEKFCNITWIYIG